jgi:WD40 repeat protein
VAYSPDGHRIVTGNEDDSVRIWNAATGEPIGKPLIGHKGTVNGVAFSPNGQRIMSGSADKTLRMWDAGTGQPIGQPLLGHLAGVNSVAFSHDGQLAVSAADDGTVRLWPAPPQAQWVSLLCDKLSANMTHGEWNDWVSPNIGYAKVCPNLPDPTS